MKHVIDTSEVLGIVDMPEAKCEVYASAIAHGRRREVVGARPAR